MKTYSILTPTRGRPDKVERNIDSIIKSSEHPERVDVLLYVDDDDPSRFDYQKLMDKYSDGPLKDVWLTIGEPMSVSKSWNIIAAKCTGDVLCMGNDDIVYAKKGWDTRMDSEIEAYVAQHPDGIWLMWFDDGINAERHCAFPMFPRLWYTTLGKFAPGIFNFFYNDTWMYDVAKKVGRAHYIPERYLEHWHWSVKPSERDATTDHARRDNNAQKDKQIWESTDHEREVDAAKLRKVMT